MSKEIETTNDGSGFYRNNDGHLLYAPNFVYHKDYELVREAKDKYKFPSYGWYWFDTRQEALDFFGIVEDVEVDTKRTYTGEEVQKLIDKVRVEVARTVK